MEAGESSEIFVPIYQTMWHHSLKDHNFDTLILVFFKVQNSRFNLMKIQYEFGFVVLCVHFCQMFYSTT
jgi:hypothetical protein